MEWEEAGKIGSQIKWSNYSGSNPGLGPGETRSRISGAAARSHAAESEFAPEEARYGPGFGGRRKAATRSGPILCVQS
jgi:hypothetical protein